MTNGNPIKIALQASTGTLGSFMQDWLKFPTGDGTWATCKAEIKGRFGEVVDDSHAQKLLSQFKQGRANVQVYSTRLLELAQDAWTPQELKLLAIQKILTNHFIDGLTDKHLSYEVLKAMQHKPKLFRTAVDKAVESQNLKIRHSLRKHPV